MQQPGAIRQRDGLGPAANGQLAVDAGGMVHDGLRAEEEILRDLRVGPAAGDGGEDLQLPAFARPRCACWVGTTPDAGAPAEFTVTADSAISAATSSARLRSHPQPCPPDIRCPAPAAVRALVIDAV